jgi:branched-chain amino acid transport system substrate-binding protein
MLKACVFLLSLLLLSQTTTSAPNRIKIGAFLSLTGSTAAYGISALNAIKLATEEANRSGGINGKQIELIVEDDHSNTQEVAEIVNKLIRDDKVDALLAEPVSTRAEMGAIVAQRSRVVMISSAAVKPELTMNRDYVFRACFISPAEGEAIAKFAFDKLNARKVAIILEARNDYALVLGSYFIDWFRRLGGEVVNQQRYNSGDTDLSAQMSSIMESKPDVIFAPGFYTTAPLIARSVKQSGFKGTLIGSDGWDSPNLLQGGSEPFEGVYFANHFWIGSEDPLVRKFVADYRAKYGVEPDAGAATAYDAARMLFDAFRRAKTTERSEVRDALAQTKDFRGVTGKITLDANRNARVPVYMLRIERGGKFTLQHQSIPTAAKTI